MKPTRFLASALAVALTAGMGALVAAPAQATQCPVVGNPTTYSPTGDYADGGSTAISSDGTTVVAAWSFPDAVTTNTAVNVSVSTNGGTNFGCAHAISDASAGVRRIEVHTSSDGAVINAAWNWDDPGSGQRVIQTSTSTDHGATWGAVQTLSPTVDRAANVVHVLMSADGTHMTAVWNHNTNMGG